jgi:hypothetical protein
VRSIVNRERGAAAILVAVMLLLLMGMAAVAIDIGLGFNERRQDQTSSDVGVMAGSIDAIDGIAVMRDQALVYARKNLTTVYSDAAWQALWEGCADTELATLNAGSWNFQAVSPPAGWSLANPANWCISFDPSGFLRVRVPDQESPTTFARVIGSTEIVTNADAISRILTQGGGGIRPFGLGSTVGEGSHQCISSGPGGNSQPPCDGPVSGNFGTLKARLFGNPALGTLENCNASPLGQVLAVNIAAGIDHFVTVDSDGLAANEIRDTCFNPGVDTLNTDTGFPNQGAAEGLVTGPIQFGLTPLLQQGTNPKLNVVGYQLDNRPLWYYLDSSLAAGGAIPAGFVPANCVKSTFDNSANPDFDWDVDGTLDRPESWEHMQVCLDDFVTGGYTTVMFPSSLGDTPRFGYLPQFWETDLGTGNSWLHIKRFKAVWIQGTWFKSGNNWVEFQPGETCSCGGSNYALKQISGLILPDNALPAELRGDPPPFGGLNPYTAQLFR